MPKHVVLRATSSGIPSRSRCPTSTGPTCCSSSAPTRWSPTAASRPHPTGPGRLEAIRRRGGRFVVVDPRRTRTAERADLYVPIRPGTDAALLAGMAQALFAERLADPGHLAGRSPDSTTSRRRSTGFAPERVATFTRRAGRHRCAWRASLPARRRAVVYGRIGTHTTAYGTLAAWLVDVAQHAHREPRPARAAHVPPRPRTRGSAAAPRHSAPAAGTAAYAACRR